MRRGRKHKPRAQSGAPHMAGIKRKHKQPPPKPRLCRKWLSAQPRLGEGGRTRSRGARRRHGDFKDAVGWSALGGAEEEEQPGVGRPTRTIELIMRDPTRRSRLYCRYFCKEKRRAAWRRCFQWYLSKSGQGSRHAARALHHSLESTDRTKNKPNVFDFTATIEADVCIGSSHGG